MNRLDSPSTLPDLPDQPERQLTQMPETHGDDTILKTAEAAKLLRISENALRTLARAGEVPHCKMGNGLRFSRRQLLQVFHERARSVQPAGLPTRR
jgi:excisionase family DNA binding protein